VFGEFYFLCARRCQGELSSWASETPGQRKKIALGLLKFWEIFAYLSSFLATGHMCFGLWMRNAVKGSQHKDAGLRNMANKY
jgi:hypothetical protein